MKATPNSSPDLAASTPRWERPLTSPFAVGLVLAVFYVVMLASLRDKSATFDEPGNATAGYTYWSAGDFRIDPENGNLTQRWIALPSLWGDRNFPAKDSAAWRNANSWALSDNWFNRLGNDTAAMLARGRAISGLLAVALGGMVWLWSRQLFGAVGGMLSLLLYVLNPTILANGALMTSDTASALFFILSLMTAWRTLERFTLARVLISALAFGCFLVVKMSSVLMVPVTVALIVIRLIDRRPLPAYGTKDLASVGSKAMAFGIGTAVHVVIAFVVIWTAYGFRFTAFAPTQGETPHFDYPWEWALDKPDHAALLTQLRLEPAQEEKAMAVLTLRNAAHRGWTQGSLAALLEIRESVLNPAQKQRLDEMMAVPPPSRAGRFVEFVRAHRLLPEAYVYGCAHVWKLSKERTAFFNGEIKSSGWPSFFPYTFLVKTPLASMGLIALAILGGNYWRRRSLSTTATTNTTSPFAFVTLPLWVFIAIYGATAIGSHINIGHRHLIPIYPALFVLCGAGGVLLQFSGGALRYLPGILLAALTIETVAWFPNYLAYFNGIVRPSQGYRHLIDSSSDWGQDLPAVRRYLERAQDSGPTYLAYFGMGSPSYYGIGATQIYGYLGFEVAAKPALKILRGLTREKDAEKIIDFLRREPAYDPQLVSTVEFGGETSVLLVKRPSAMRLTGGTYLISGTLIQPVHYSKAFGPWSDAHEATYQRLRETVRPLFSDDLRARASALEAHSAIEWLQAFDDFGEYRFARLTAHLRKREPDGNINYSVLIYHLTDAEIALALDGPSP